MRIVGTKVPAPAIGVIAVTFYAIVLFTIYFINQPLKFSKKETTSVSDTIKLSSSKNECSIDDNIHHMMEYAYFQGQKEALQGDIRIRKNTSNEKYHWIKSPWNSDISLHMTDSALIKNLEYKGE